MHTDGPTQGWFALEGALESFSPVLESRTHRPVSNMTPLKAFAVTLLLCCLWYAAESQPTAIEPVLPPIPNPPYSHKVRFCGIADNETFSLNSTTLNQCDWKRYIQSYVPFLAGPIALAAIALVICIVLPIVLCCKCCKRDSVDGFTRILFVAAFGALLFVGFILIYVGNAKTTTVVNGLSSTVSKTIGTAEVRINTARTIAAQLPYTNDSSAMSTFDSASSALAGFQSSTVSVSNRVKTYDGYRQAALFVGSLVPLVMIIAAAVLGICNTGKPFMGILAWTLVFLSIVVWICMGVHLAIGKALSDICWEVELAQAQGETGALAIIVKCQTDSSPLQDLRNLVKEGINNATTAGCNTMEQACFVPNGGPVNCTLPSWTCNETTIVEWPEFNMTDFGLTCTDGSFIDPSGSCPGAATVNGTFSSVMLVSECPTNCKNPQFKDAATQGIDGLATLVNYYGLRDQLVPILSCEFIAEAFIDAKTTVCKTFENSLTLIFAGATLEAVGMGLAMAALVHFFMGLSGEKFASNPRSSL